MYTLVIDDNEKADKLKNSLPPGIYFTFFIFNSDCNDDKKNYLKYDFCQKWYFVLPTLSDHSHWIKFLFLLLCFNDYELF